MSILLGLAGGDGWLATYVPMTVPGTHELHLGR